MKYILTNKFLILKYSFGISKPLLVCLASVMVNDINNVLVSLGYCLSIIYAIVKIIKENKK